MFAVIGVDGDDDDDYGGGGEEKCCDLFAYSCQQLQTQPCLCSISTLFLCLVKIIFTKYDRVCRFQCVYLVQVLYRSYVLRHHLLLSVLCS